MTDTSRYLTMIKHAVDRGVLSKELCPEREYWHWAILKPKDLSPMFYADQVAYGEVRFYGNEP